MSKIWDRLSLIRAKSNPKQNSSFRDKIMNTCMHWKRYMYQLIEQYIEPCRGKMRLPVKTVNQVGSDMHFLAWNYYYILSYPSFQSYVLGAQKNCLIETVLLSTHNICSGWEIRKSIFNCTVTITGGWWNFHIYFCLFVLLLYVPSQQLWSLQDGQFTIPHFFLGRLEQAVNQ